MNILLVAADVSENSLGRVHVLWELCHYLKWNVTICAPQKKDIWPPLAGSDFASNIVYGSPKSILKRLESKVDLVIGCKARAESFRLGITLSRHLDAGFAMDIDDPDLEFQFEDLTLKTKVRRWARPLNRLTYVYLRNAIHQYDTIVSNPILQQKYGGWIVPHARNKPARAPSNISQKPYVAFVGTVHPHKGIAQLRTAVEELQENLVIDLVVTGAKPIDAKPWEQWVGVTSLEAGKQIIQDASVIAIPSLDISWGKAQLPAKLMDALIMGKAICVSDVGPMKWAVGNAAKVLPPGDIKALKDAIKELMKPSIAAEYAQRASLRGSELFSVASVAEVFRLACQSIISLYESQEQDAL